MSSALRFARQLVAKASATGPGASTSLLAKNSTTTVAALQLQQRASIKSLASQERDGDTSCQLLPPWPYKERKYHKIYKLWNFIDPTYIRMNENSKVITVEGNIGSRKAEFAQELAKRFGMLYFPEPRIDDLFVNHQGFDYRSLNKYIAEGVQAVDEKMYYENPLHKGVPWMKVFFYRLRFAQYIDALAHLFNTGQGVVLERSPQSEFVFADAMFENGWLPQDAYDFYYRLRYDSIHKLLRPHMVIYLDVEPEVCLKRIKERNIPYQVNSPVLTLDYLRTIEKSYKEKYLPDISTFSEMLMFKWTDPPADAMDEVVHDVEKASLGMEGFDIRGQKYKDWAFYWNKHWDEARFQFTTQKYEMLFEMNITDQYDVDSIFLDAVDCEHREEVFKSFIPYYAVAPQWDPSKVNLWRQFFGFSNYWTEMAFKMRAPYY